MIMSSTYKPAHGKTFLASYSFGNKPNSQTLKTRNSEIYSALTRWTMKSSQNVQRGPWDKQRGGDATDWLLQQQSNGTTFN